MSLESNKTLGGIGAILLAIPVLNIVGIILVLIAMKGLAEYYNEKRIFENALYGFIFGIIGIAAFVAVLFIGIFTFFFFLPWVIVGLVIMFVFFLLQAVFYRNSFTILSDKSGEKMFDTAGLLLLIGAILTIILVGTILQFIAWILAAVGFFSIKIPTGPVPATTAPPTTTPAPAPTVSVPVEKKYCRYCGTENRTDAAFCEKCGKRIAEE